MTSAARRPHLDALFAACRARRSLPLRPAAPRPARASTALAAAAQRIDALEPFLSRFVGHCTDPYERQTCEANVRAARQAVAGKTFAVRVTDAAPLVRAELEGDGFVLLVTPFVDGGGLALTARRARRGRTPPGNPLVSLIPIRGKLAARRACQLEFQGPFRTGAIELEIVFRPERTWKLPRRGEPRDATRASPPGSSACASWTRERGT